MANLKELLSDGRLGPVQIGMVPEMVERVLGSPDGRSERTDPVEFWKYGSLQMAFKRVPGADDSRLVGITIYFAVADLRVPPEATFEDWSPNGQTTEVEVRGFLEAVGLKVHSRVDGEHTNLVLESGAGIAFAEGHLHNIRFYRADRATIRRQVSVSLPDRTLSLLRVRARERKISLQELLEEVISTSEADGGAGSRRRETNGEAHGTGSI